MADSVLLASFLPSVRGVCFYDVNVSSVREGRKVAFQLESTNMYQCMTVTVRQSTSIPVS